MDKNPVKDGILSLLQTKAVVKQDVYENTKACFNQLRNVLTTIPDEYHSELESPDSRISIECLDRGEYIVQLKVAGDVLVFQMHTNAFEFDRDHEIWKSEYVKNDVYNSYCGVINIYNFLHDSFRYNRHNDLGYLIARIFVNKDGHFFVEGKRQKGMGVNHFGTSLISPDNWKRIVEVAILYSLEFDLLVPPYDDIKIISMVEMSEEILNSKMRTGKRLGFKYNSDDVKQ